MSGFGQGLVVLAVLASIFVLAFFLGGMRCAQRRVDRLLAKETRIRTPPADDAAPVTPAVYRAGWRMQGLTAEDAFAGARRFSEHLRADPAHEPAEMLPPMPTDMCGDGYPNRAPAEQELLDTARRHGRCGTPVRTSLGNVACLRAPGHSGICQ